VRQFAGGLFFPKNVICTFLCIDALICHIKALLLSYSKLLSFPCLEKSCIQPTRTAKRKKKAAAEAVANAQGTENELAKLQELVDRQDRIVEDAQKAAAAYGAKVQEISSAYQHVYTPPLASVELYKTSGHWDHYQEDMFPTMDMGDGEEFVLRPMNCPHHIQVFKHHVHSYRELPIRIAEIGMMHRYEKSGALTGLQRVREMSLNDGHLFVTPEQIQEEFQRALQLIIDVYEDFNLTEYRFRLSLRDPQDTHKYFDNDEMWENAQTMLRAALDEMGVDYFEAEGEAAFYGPKLDIQVKTALGKEETLSTIQLDFLLPERFDLKYIGADGEEHRPVMIHRGVISTMERFTAILIENYKGAFPTWLAPHQVTLIPVSNEKHVDYAWEVAKKLRDRGVRADVDERNEKMQFKIRASQTSKIPYQLIVGDKEMEDGTVNVRRYGQKETQTVSVDDFVQAILADIANKSRVEK